MGLEGGNFNKFFLIDLKMRIKPRSNQKQNENYFDLLHAFFKQASEN
jgi:hypothetical protein